MSVEGGGQSEWNPTLLDLVTDADIDAPVAPDAHSDVREVDLDGNVDAGGVREQHVDCSGIDVLVELEFIRIQRRVLVGLDRLADGLAERNVFLVGVIASALG